MDSLIQPEVAHVSEMVMATVLENGIITLRLQSESKQNDED